MNNDGLYSASLVTTVTSACISVGFITILGFLFDFVALKLTEWEIPKTEAEFQNRLSIKVMIVLYKNKYVRIDLFRFFRSLALITTLHFFTLLSSKIWASERRIDIAL